MHPGLANWSDEPVSYLTSRRYVDRAYPVVDVRGYSNADRAVLILNGKRVGKAQCVNRICVWPRLALAPGANRLAVTAWAKGRIVTDSISWTAPDPAHGVAVDSGALTGTVAADGQRYGSDNFLLGGKGKALSGPHPFRPAPNVEGVDTPAFATYREGHFSYDIPLPDGRWTGTLAMLEPDSAKASTRRFIVRANGETALGAFSPSAAAGGVRKPVFRRFDVRTSRGRLLLEFIPDGGDAIISAISVRPRTS